MATYTVGTVQALSQTLKTAVAGDTILLESGSYSGVSLRGLSFDSPVVITSKDPSAPAIMTDMTLRDSRGVTFSNLEWVVDPKFKTDNPFQILGSQNVNLVNLSVHGSMNGDPSDDKSAVLIRESSAITVTKSEFQQLLNALSYLDSDRVTITNNSFHDIRTDAVRGGGTNNLQVVGNTFYDFYPAAGDHPDAIQLWTTNTTVAAHDIYIANNVILRGAGEAMQGIFLRDGSDQLPYENVVITGNFVVGGMFNGIMVDGGRNIQVTHNTVTGFEDMKSWIRLENVTSGALVDNEAQAYVIVGSSGYQDFANKTIAAVPNIAQALLKSLLSQGDAASRLATATGLPFSGDAGAHDTFSLGGDGPDVLAAKGAGPAWIEGGAGNDQIQGGAGADYLRGDAGDDQINGGAGFDDINGNAGNDTIRGGLGADWVVGGKDNDVLYGDEDDDLVYGNAGNDTCYGGTGADWVRGGQGDDLLFGGDGADFISGDLGSDTMSGGAGADTFNISAGGGRDLISDFSVAEGDRVRLEGIGSYAVNQIGADTVIEYNGGSVILAGVQMSGLPAGWVFSA